MHTARKRGAGGGGGGGSTPCLQSWALRLNKLKEWVKIALSRESIPADRIGGLLILIGQRAISIHWIGTISTVNAPWNLSLSSKKLITFPINFYVCNTS